MKKFCIAFAGSIFLALSGAVIAAASENETFLEGYEVDDGKLRIFCSDIVPEEETADGCKLSLGGQELSVISVESEKEKHTPITYYCLADVSGSMSGQQMSQVRETLLAVTEGLKDGDNMVVGTLGNQTNISGFLTEKEELQQVINALEAGKEDTNLYAGIVESIRVLQTDAAVNPRKCLIILSDGEDDQKTGITQTETEKAITDSSIPVYTVATLKDAANEAGISNAKLLGSFARMSTGGAHYAPVLDDSTGEQAGQSILLSMQEGFVVSVDLPAMTSEKDVLLLRMVYTSSDNIVHEDTMELYAEDLRVSKSTEVQTEEDSSEYETESSQAETEEPEPVPDTQLKSILMWLIPVAAVLIVAAVIIIVLLKGKNKKDSGDGIDAADMSGGETKNTAVGFGNLPESTAGAKTDNMARRSYELRLYAIGYSKIVHTIRLEQGKEVTVGRNSKADIILDSDDKKLSGIQCRLQWDGGKLYVWDMDSTNGTFVNGISIKSMGRVSVHEGETIRMGSYEYRIGREEKGNE